MYLILFAVLILIHEAHSITMDEFLTEMDRIKCSKESHQRCVASVVEILRQPIEITGIPYSKSWKFEDKSIKHRLRCCRWCRSSKNRNFNGNCCWCKNGNDRESRVVVVVSGSGEACSCIRNNIIISNYKHRMLLMWRRWWWWAFKWRDTSLLLEVVVILWK